MSRFLRIKCECGNEQNTFGNATCAVPCLVCEETLTTPTGSRALVNTTAKILKVL